MMRSGFYTFFLTISLVFNSYSIFAFEVTELETNLEIQFESPSQKLKSKQPHSKNKIKLIGRNQGVRHKKVTFFNIDVYEARLYFEESKLKIVDPSELINSSQIAIKLKPLRSFGGDKLKEAMIVSYEKNNISPDSKAQIEFLDLVSKNKVIKDEDLYLFGLSLKDQDHLYLMMKGVDAKISGHKGFIKEVFSVWLGEPVDKDLSELKQILISEIKI